jgi:hypothetical protein
MMIDSAPSELQLHTEELRLAISEFALRAKAENVAFAIRTTRGAPRYQLVPPTLVSPETLRACVRIGPDEFRRHSTDIRALVRLHDMPFGLVIRGELTAVLRRHPTYRPRNAERYLAHLRAHASRDLPNPEENQGAIAEQLRDHEVRITALERHEAGPGASRRRVRSGSGGPTDDLPPK